MITADLLKRHHLHQMEKLQIKTSFALMRQGYQKKRNMMDSMDLPQILMMNRKTSSAENIISVNHQRWQIEECFRIMKSEFNARPVYLKNDD